MRISELRALEPYDETLRATLEEGWSGVLQRPFRLTSGKGDQVWHESQLLSVCFTPDVHKDVRLYVRNLMRYTQVPWRMLPQWVLGTTLSSQAGVHFLSKPTFSVSPAIPNAEHQFILPGNRRHRVFDLAGNRAWSFLKPNATTRCMQVEIDIRANGKQGPFPPISCYDKDLRWFEEPLLKGFSLARIPFGRGKEDYEREAFDKLNGWLDSSLQTVSAEDYVEELIQSVREQLEAASCQEVSSDCIQALSSTLFNANKFPDIQLAQSHGDFHGANILVLQDSRELILTDWEYSARRSRYFDGLGYILKARWPTGLGRRVADFIDQGTPKHSYRTLLPGSASKAWRRWASALFLLEELKWSTDKSNLTYPSELTTKTKLFLEEIQAAIAEGAFKVKPRPSTQPKRTEVLQAPKQIIPENEYKRHASSDLQGYVFTWKGDIYRAIYPAAGEAISELFECGLIQELVDQGLFPGTEVTNYETRDCPMVLRHEIIPVATLPSEWSFSMLRDAAIAVLRVNQIAKRYGYQTIDAHGFNVMFYRGRPLFVDLGSFIRIENDFHCSKPGWRPYGEFMRFFYGPLKLWSTGESYFARHALHGIQMPMTSYWRFRHFLLRLIPLSILNRFEFYYYKYKTLNTVPMEEFLQMASSSSFQKWGARLVLWLSRKKLLWFSSVNLEKLERKTARIKKPRVPTKWAHYHSDTKIGKRFEYITNFIKERDIKTVLDMAGNAGFLSRNIVQNSAVEHVICADYDENAIDSLYCRQKEENLAIYPVVLDFSISVSDSKLKDVLQRFKSDAVLALALTHHLILTQGLTVDFILNRLKGFGKKYVLVEFMPLGHYSSVHKMTPEIPSWYTLEWFRKHFLNHFKLLHEQELDLNRVLFVGEIQMQTEDDG